MNTKKILIVCALEAELKVAKNYMKEKRPASLQVDFFVSGVWNIKTSLLLSQKLTATHYDFVVNYGVCGYSEGNEKQNVIQVVRSYYLPSQKEVLPPLFFEFAPLRSIACSETPVYDHELLWEENYVDMESFAIENVCEHFRIPRIILKVPVDKIGEETLNFNKEKALTLLEKNINFEKLLTDITDYIEKLPHKIELKEYMQNYHLTKSEQILLKKYIAKYESLSGKNFSVFFQKHAHLEKKVFFTTLTQYLDTLSELW